MVFSANKSKTQHPYSFCLYCLIARHVTIYIPGLTGIHEDKLPLLWKLIAFWSWISCKTIFLLHHHRFLFLNPCIRVKYQRRILHKQKQPQSNQQKSTGKLQKLSEKDTCFGNGKLYGLEYSKFDKTKQRYPESRAHKPFRMFWRLATSYIIVPTKILS